MHICMIYVFAHTKYEVYASFCVRNTKVGQSALIEGHPLYAMVNP